MMCFCFALTYVGWEGKERLFKEEWLVTTSITDLDQALFGNRLLSEIFAKASTYIHNLCRRH